MYSRLVTKLKYRGGCRLIMLKGQCHWLDFPAFLFSLIDSMSELKQFKFDVKTRDSGIPIFSYNTYMSYFIKSLTFVCIYNLEKIFVLHRQWNIPFTLTME